MSWVGYCHGCHRDDREVETRYEHSAKTLCDECAGMPPMRLKTSPIYDSDTLTAPSRETSGTLVVEPKDTKTRTRTKDNSFGKENKRTEEPQAVELPQEKTAEIDLLLAEHKAGRMEPVEVRLPNVPADAPPLMLQVVADFELVAGLRRACYDHDPVIYSCRWAAKRIGGSHGAVAKMLRALVKLGALTDEGTMPPYRGHRGTKLYLPGV